MVNLVITKGRYFSAFRRFFYNFADRQEKIILICH